MIKIPINLIAIKIKKNAAVRYVTIQNSDPLLYQKFKHNYFALFFRFNAIFNFKLFRNRFKIFNYRCWTFFLLFIAFDLNSNILKKFQFTVGSPNFVPCPYRIEPNRTVPQRFCFPYHDQVFENLLPYRTTINTKF